MDAETLAAVQLDCHQQGVRYYRNKGEHVQALYHAVRKRLAMGGDGTVSTRQLARDLYPDVAEDLAQWRKRRESVRRWLAVLERQGLISMHELRSPGGKSLGLRITLLPVPERVARLAASRGCSSVGSSVSQPLPRRPLCPQEARDARVRPWCPNAARGAPWRFAQPRGGFFSPTRFGAPGAPHTPLKGLCGAVEISHTGAARARGGGGLVACQRPDDESAIAALERRITAALGEEALRTLQAAESAFEARFGQHARLARLVERVERQHEGQTVRHHTLGYRLHHFPTIRQLWWALERLDRYASLGEGRAGAGLNVLERLLDTHAADVAEGSAAAPRHLGYFIPALQVEGKRWKHTWAPRIKDRRIAEGRRRPRRAAGSPGRGGPATGKRPRRRRDQGSGQ